MTPEELLLNTRFQLTDVGKSFLQTIIATGHTNRYGLNYAPVQAESIQVYVNSVDVSLEVAVEEHTGVLIFQVPEHYPKKDDVITAAGMHFRFFTDDELMHICRDATEMHTAGHTAAHGGALTLASLSPVEDLPVSIMCAIQAIYVLLTDAAFDIDINAPDGVNIPRSERYRQLTELLQILQGRYQDLSSQLNVGLYAMQVFTLRRISKRTNRLVPIYVPQEIDDRTYPVRVWLPIPTYGGAPKPGTGVHVEDLGISKGSTYVRQFQFTIGDLPWDLTGYTAKMQIRKSAPETYAPITLSTYPGQGLIIDGPAGIITMTLTATQTGTLLPSSAVYDMEVYLGGVTTRVVEGRIFGDPVHQQVTR